MDSTANCNCTKMVFTASCKVVENFTASCPLDGGDYCKLVGDGGKTAVFEIRFSSGHFIVLTQIILKSLGAVLLGSNGTLTASRTFTITMH